MVDPDFQTSVRPAAPPYRCRSCGHVEGNPHPDLTCTHCPHCPAWSCDQCGEMNTTLNLCSCWIDITEMPLADIKAAFACECNDHNGLSVNTDGSLSVVQP